MESGSPPEGGATVGPWSTDAAPQNIVEGDLARSLTDSQGGRASVPSDRPNAASDASEAVPPGHSKGVAFDISFAPTKPKRKKAATGKPPKLSSEAGPSAPGPSGEEGQGDGDEEAPSSARPSDAGDEAAAGEYGLLRSCFAPDPRLDLLAVISRLCLPQLRSINFAPACGNWGPTRCSPSQAGRFALNDNNCLDCLTPHLTPGNRCGSSNTREEKEEAAGRGVPVQEQKGRYSGPGLRGGSRRGRIAPIQFLWLNK